MPSLDINFDYNKIQKKVNATKSFTDIKSQYDEANRKAGQSFEKTKLKMNTHWHLFHLMMRIIIIISIVMFIHINQLLVNDILRNICILN